MFKRKLKLLLTLDADEYAYKKVWRDSRGKRYYMIDIKAASNGGYIIYGVKA